MRGTTLIRLRKAQPSAARQKLPGQGRSRGRPSRATCVHPRNSGRRNPRPAAPPFTNRRLSEAVMPRCFPSSSLAARKAARRYADYCIGRGEKCQGGFAVFTRKCFAGDMFAAAGQQGAPAPDRQGGNPRHGRRTDGVRRNLHHHRAKGERPAHPREMTE